jgi:hypothetical protein
MSGLNVIYREIDVGEIGRIGIANASVATNIFLFISMNPAALAGIIVTFKNLSS